jgi:hypothetical protein
MARATPATAERRIVFYRVDGGLDEDGAPRPVDLSGALRHIGTLPFTDNGRYLVGDNDLVTCCWVDRLDQPSRVRIANVRRSGLPQVEETGDLQPLRIRAGQGIAEQVHMVLFDDQVEGVQVMIAGAVFNFYGPRLPRLGYYLTQRARGLAPRVTFRPLLRRDAAEALERLTDIRLFRLRITPSFVQSIEAVSDSLGTSFTAAREVGQAEDIEIVLRPPRRSRRPLGEGLLGLARSLVRRDDLNEGVIDFEVKGLNGETGRVDLVDILNDKLVGRKQILRQDGRGRALNDASAYSAVEEAYGELHDELIRAASVWAPA